MVKNLPAVQETHVPSLGWKDPLEEEMATHSSILVWRIPWTEEPGGLQLQSWTSLSDSDFTFSALMRRYMREFPLSSLCHVRLYRGEGRVQVRTLTRHCWRLDLGLLSLQKD